MAEWAVSIDDDSNNGGTNDGGYDIERLAPL